MLRAGEMTAGSEEQVPTEKSVEGLTMVWGVSGMLQMIRRNPNNNWSDQLSESLPCKRDWGELPVNT